MADFQVTIHGRFWVTAEDARTQPRTFLNPRSLELHFATPSEYELVFGLRLSLTLFEKMPILRVFEDIESQEISTDNPKQLILFDF